MRAPLRQIYAETAFATRTGDIKAARFMCKAQLGAARRTKAKAFFLFGEKTAPKSLDLFYGEKKNATKDSILLFTRPKGRRVQAKEAIACRKQGRQEQPKVEKDRGQGKEQNRYAQRKEEYRIGLAARQKLFKVHGISFLSVNKSNRLCALKINHEKARRWSLYLCLPRMPRHRRKAAPPSLRGNSCFSPMRRKAANGCGRARSFLSNS